MKRRAHSIGADVIVTSSSQGMAVKLLLPLEAMFSAVS
jgi:signal transduction histidine kinase